MSKQITLTLNDASGNAIGQYNINTAGSPLHIEAIDGAYYQFTDAATGIGPEGIITERVNDDLLVSFDEGTDLVIENYFAQSQPGALVGLQADGGLTSYPVATAPEHVLAEQIAAEQTLGSDQPVWAPLGVLGAVGLVAAGIGLASDNGGKSNNSSNNNGNGGNTPSPNNPNNPGNTNPPNPNNPNNPGNQTPTPPDPNNPGGNQPHDPPNPNNPGNPNTPPPVPQPPIPTPPPATDPRPEAKDDPVKGTPGNPVTIDVLDNDYGVDANNQRDLDPSSLRLIDAAGNRVTEITVAGQGKWNVSFGKVVFTPEPGFTGDPTPVKYEVRDFAGQVSNQATITINYSGGQTPPPSGNHAPTDITLANSKVTEGKDGATIGKLTTTDLDAGDVHTYTVSDSRFEITADGTLKLKAGQHLDFGKEPTVKLSVTSNDGHGGTYTKEFTLQVQDDPNWPANPQPPVPNPNHEGKVEITGEAKVGSELKATVTDEDGVPADVQYQWLANGVAIVGATGSSYTLTAAEAGKTISVRATYTDNAKHSEAVTSAATKAVEDPANPQPPVPNPNHEGKVEITGDAKVGSELKATVSDEDGVPADVQYQWLANGVAIAGATGSSYTLTAAEAGKTISVRATYTDNAKHSEAVTSAATKAVEDPANPQPPVPNPNHEGKVEITGDAKVGSELKATVSDEDGVPADVQYQWLANGVAIAGATGSSYTLTAAEAGKTITVRATYTDNAKHSEAVTSAATKAVEDPANPQPPVPNPNHEGKVEITGEAKVGETLNATVSDEDGVPADVQYQWLANGVAIAGATGSSYTLTAAEAGKTITVRATYTDNAKHSEAVTSAATKAVEDPANPQPPVPNPNHEGKVEITGDAKVGSELKATVSDEDGVPADVQYQWLANGVAIAGATGSSYTLTAAEAGKTITVRATYTDNAQHSEAVTSAATKAVEDPANPQPPVPNPNHEGKVEITGEAKVGETLNATVSDDDGVPADVQYQWLANGVAIAGATGSSYTLTAAEAGKTISVRAIYTDNAQHSEAVTSAATKAVEDPANPQPPVPNPNHEGKVEITGDAKVGETLNATVSDEDGVPADVQYQWLANGVAIAGATGSSYTLTAAEAGKTITVRATYTDNAKHSEAVTSEATKAVEDPANPRPPVPNPNHEGKVEITGEAKVGSELKATVSDEDGVPADVQYQWLANGVAIAGATGSSYTLTAAEAGKTITVRATYTDNAQHSEAVTSAATKAVEDPANPQPPVPNPNHEGKVEITGEAKVGETLNATVSDEDGVPADVQYQWLANGVAIAGATGSSYTLTAAEAGKTITVRATYTDNAQHSEAVVSQATKAVEDPANPQPPVPNPNHEGKVEITGEAKVGETLNATVSDEDGVPADVQYQWLANGVAIAGATGSSYTLTAAEAGKTITVRATYTDNAKHSEAVTSAATKAVEDPANPQPPVPNPNHEGKVEITGDAKVGETLNATVSDEDGVPADVQYQWLANGVAIAGATGSSYTLTAAEAGKTISVRATYTDNAQHSEAVTSAATKAVEDPANPQPPVPNPNHEGKVEITGDAKVGSELKATVSDEDGVPADVQYQWLANGVAIAGATGSSYTLTAAEAGKTITVRATYTDNAQHSEAVVSQATKAVEDPANPQPPVPSPNHEGKVEIEGEAKVGSELKATVTDEDGVPADVQYQWLANGVAIAGATGSSYTLTAAEAGKTITVRATYTDNAQHSEAVTSAATKAVEDPANPQPPVPNPNHEGKVEITGDAKVGSELKATVSDEDGVPADVQYQWLANGVAIAGATGSSYTLTAAEAGKTITVRATYTDNAQHSEAVVSAATKAVEDPANPQPPVPNPNHEGKVEITGEAKVGSELKATVSDEDGVPADVQYQWLANGVAIAGATGSSYTLTAAEAGKTITVRAIYTDNAQHSEAVVSAATKAVEDPANPQPPVPTPNQEGTVAIEGEAKVGATLTAKVTDADDFDASKVKYQWFADGEKIDGATASTLTLTDAQKGKTITVQAEYEDAKGNAEHPTSQATKAVEDPQTPPPAGNHEPTGSVTISGKAVVGETLTASNDLQDEDGLGTITYRWFANGEEVGQGDSYTLKAEDKGKTITAKAEYTDGKGTAESVESAKTAEVADAQTPPQNHLGHVTISGVAQASETLTATVSDEDGVPDAGVVYQWLRDGQAIDGATGATYRLTVGDIGKKISVRATYQDNAKHDESLVGAETAAVADNRPLIEQDSVHQGGVIVKPPENSVYLEISYRDEDDTKRQIFVRKDPASGEWHSNELPPENLDAQTGTVTLAPNMLKDGSDVMARSNSHDDFEHISDPVNVTAGNDIPDIGLPEVMQDSTHQGGMIIKPGRNADALEIAYTDEQGQPHELTVRKDFEDKWQGENLPSGVQVDATTGTVTIAPNAVQDQSEVRVRNTNRGHDVSDYVKAITDVDAPNQPGTVTITGEAKVGGELTAKVMDADGVPDNVQYQWLRDGVEIPGANSNIYRLAAEDAGKHISVRATYRDNAQNDEAPISEQTGEVSGNTQANQPGSVAITGEAKVGQTLTAEVSDADTFYESQVSYQWLRDGAEIAGATGKTYRLTDADADHKISVKASYKDNAGHDEMPTSAQTDNVAGDQGMPTVSMYGSRSVPEGGKSIYTVTLDKAASHDVTVDVGLEYYSGGTPLNSLSLSSKTVRIPAGETQATFTVSAPDNNEVNSRPGHLDTGRFDVQIKNVTGAMLNADGSKIAGTVIDDEATTAPVARLSTEQPLQLAGETVTYKVALSKPATRPVTVGIDVEHGNIKVGTEEGSDLRLSAKKITIPAGETEATFTITAKDGLVTGAETQTFRVRIDSLEGASLEKRPGLLTAGAINEAVEGSVSASDSNPQVRLVGHDLDVREGSSVTYKLQLNHATDHDVRVTVNCGSNGGTPHFTEGVTKTVVIPKGQTSAEFTLTATDDQVAMGARSANLTIDSAEGAEVSHTSHFTNVRILDNDPMSAPSVTKDTQSGTIRFTPGFDPNEANNDDAFMEVRFTDRAGQTYQLWAKHDYSGWRFHTEHRMGGASGVSIDSQTGTVTIPQAMLQPGSEAVAQNFNDPLGSAGSASASERNTANAPENTAPGGAYLHTEPAMQHEADSNHDNASHQQGSDGHDVLVSDGIDTAAYSQLVSLEGSDLLNYLGQHSAELLAATQHSNAHTLRGGAGDDVLIAGHGAELLTGGVGADTFAYLLDSNDATSWQQASKIADFNPAEGDRIVLAGDERLAHAKLEVSTDEQGQHLHISDDAGHSRTIDIAGKDGKTLTAEDILSHVEIRTPQGYEPSAYNVPQTQHLPHDDHSHLI